MRKTQTILLTLLLLLAVGSAEGARKKVIKPIDPQKELKDKLNRYFNGYRVSSQVLRNRSKLAELQICVRKETLITGSNCFTLLRPAWSCSPIAGAAASCFCSTGFRMADCMWHCLCSVPAIFIRIPQRRMRDAIFSKSSKDSFSRCMFITSSMD